MADNAQQQAVKGPTMNDLIVAEKIAQWQRLKALVLDSSKWRKRVFLMTKVCSREAKEVRTQIEERRQRETPK